MNELWLLKIECEIPGIVYINGGIAGETPSASLCRYVSSGRVYISFAPVCGQDARVFIGFSRIINLSYNTPTIMADDGVLSLFILPGSVCLARISPPFIPLPQTPYTLAFLEFSGSGRQYIAEIYFDLSFQFCLSEGSGRMLLVCPLLDGLKEPHLFTRRLGEQTYLFGEAKKNGNSMLLCVQPSTATLLFLEECADYTFGENTIDLFFDIGDPYGHMLVSHRTLVGDNAQYEDVLRQQKGHVLAVSPANTAIALILAVKYGNEDLALSYLANSLKSEVTFKDLRDFFGEIRSIEHSFSRPGEIAIASPFTEAGNVFYVRIFSIEFSGDKISNIVEQE